MFFRNNQNNPTDFGASSASSQHFQHTEQSMTKVSIYKHKRNDPEITDCKITISMTIQYLQKMINSEAFTLVAKKKEKLPKFQKKISKQDLY